MEQPELLKYTIQALERLGIPYAIVGSFASGVWGETLFTQDIDILVALKSTCSISRAFSNLVAMLWTENT